MSDPKFKTPMTGWRVGHPDGPYANCVVADVGDGRSRMVLSANHHDGNASEIAALCASAPELAAENRRLKDALKISSPAGDVESMVRARLEILGADGLCHPDSLCGCELSDLMPCDDPSPACAASKRVTYPTKGGCPGGECGGGCDWHMVPIAEG